MTIKDWKPRMPVSVIGAINFENTTERGMTTQTPPFRDRNTTRVEVEVENGKIKNVAIGRLKLA